MRYSKANLSVQIIIGLILLLGFCSLSSSAQTVKLGDSRQDVLRIKGVPYRLGDNTLSYRDGNIIHIFTFRYNIIEREQFLTRGDESDFKYIANTLHEDFGEPVDVERNGNVYSIVWQFQNVYCILQWKPEINLIITTFQFKRTTLQI